LAGAGGSAKVALRGAASTRGGLGRGARVAASAPRGGAAGGVPGRGFGEPGRPSASKEFDGRARLGRGAAGWAAASP
jgi:hypothetical protein